MPRVVAVIQARMGASRLPNKMMLHLKGYPIVEWIYKRISRVKKLDGIIFAIPDSSLDNVLATYLKQLGAKTYRGSEKDVLDRFYGAAQESQATHVVRICADNPFICPEVIDDLIHFYFDNPCDYAYNHIPRGNLYPDGLGAEIVQMDLLKTIWRVAQTASQREHAFNYIWDHQEQFKIKTFDPIDPRLERPELKLDIDTLDDYNKLLSIPVHLEMSALEIVTLCKKIL
jgi:spore coat polysaccharide biosynthesis protein SpsF